MKIGVTMSWIYKDLIPPQCCCCIPLHTGALVIGILDIVGGFTSLIAGIITIATDDEDLLLNMAIFGAGIMLGILLAVEGAALVFAVVKSNQVAIVVHIVLSMVLIVIYMVNSVLCLFLGIYGYAFGYGCFALFFIITVIKVYFLLCILGYYEIMKMRED